MKITRKQAAAIAIKEGKNYSKLLADTVLHVIFKDKISNEIECINIEFYPHNFQHLTGLCLKDKDTGNAMKHSADYFYKKCVDGRLSGEELIFADPNTIDLKLQALPYISQITRISKMVGEYNPSTKIRLDADYVVGGVNSCIGISKYEGRNACFPRTCLYEDIRKVTKYTSQVLAVYKSQLPYKEEAEMELMYIAKGFSADSINVLNVIQKNAPQDE